MFLDRYGRLGGALSLALILSGCTAGNPSSEPAPATTTAAADFVAVGTAPPSAPATSPLVSLGLPATTLPTDSTLVGPHYAVTGRLSAGQRAALGLAGPGRGTDLVAAPGSELLLVHADRVTTVSVLDPDGPAPTAAVLLADGPRALPAGVPGANAVVVVSVPVGGAGMLAVTDADRRQSIDLRTGRPGPDADPLFRPQWTATAEVSELDRIGGLDRTIRVRLQLRATLRPYLPRLGWAPTGRTWLAVDVTVRVPGEVGLRLDLARSLTIRADRPLAVPPGVALVPGSDPGGGTDRVAHWSGGFSVPATLRTVTAHYATAGTFTRAGSDTTLSFTGHPVDSDTTLRLTPVG
jgi:hypothetical protein